MLKIWVFSMLKTSVFGHYQDIFVVHGVGVNGKGLFPWGNNLATMVYAKH